MLVHLWPSDAPTLEALSARIAEIKAAGDQPVASAEMVTVAAKLIYESECGLLARGED